MKGLTFEIVALVLVVIYKLIWKADLWSLNTVVYTFIVVKAAAGD